VISPLLLNIALHGMEAAAGVRYLSSGSIRVDSPALIRYADDFVVHCHTRQDAIKVKARLAAWLAPRGLSFSEERRVSSPSRRALTSWDSTSADTAAGQ
jgi:RNA-directed DNA polymerase